MDDLAIGLLETFLSVILFGSCLVPIKKYDIGDGMFVQWAMSVGIFVCGFAILPITGFPPIQPYATLGGASWAIGNALLIPIVEVLGVGPCYLLPDSISCMLHFIIGYNGLVWTEARPPTTKWLAFVALTLILIGGGLISQVKKRTAPFPSIATSSNLSQEKSFDIFHYGTSTVVPSKIEIAHDGKTKQSKSLVALKEIFKKLKRPFCVGIALSAGVFFVLGLTTVIASQDSHEMFAGDGQHHDISYFVFSYFVGAFMCSTVIFIGYSMIKGNDPQINPKIFLPAFVGGIMWSAGMLFWILSIEKLSQPVAGPITAMMPGLVACLWSEFYFREIKEGRSKYFLCFSILLTFTGAIMMAVSK
ncbi:transmembrane family of transporters domain-containing protein [Ditylenchus destructor]|nr:transmembrane family of transporters domain-containing protein [Ditylenchus destructor]